jgi:hypothetical protein
MSIGDNKLTPLIQIEYCSLSIGCIFCGDIHFTTRGEPTRNVARLKMGYYPLPEAEAVKLRSLLSFVGPASVIDPCVGQRTALHR